MDIHSSTLDTSFDLFPIIIPGAVEQVKPVGLADVGVSQNLANSDSRGLEVIIDPPAEMKLLGSSTESSIRVDIYIVDNPNAVTGKNITEGEENKRMTLHVPPKFLSHGVNRLYYKLTRASGNKQPSRELSVLYHLRTSTGLVLTIPPDIREKGVDAAQAAKGVLFTFTYSNRRPFDRIEFLLGDTIVRFDVPDGSAPITCTLFTEDFEKAGDNPEAIAEFSVIDQLGNHAQSPQQTLGIHLVEVELSPPTLVKPAVDPIDVLNHKNGVTIRIDYPGAQPGDRARLIEVKPPAGATPFPLVQFNTNNRVNTVLAQAYLVARQGKEILFRWNLNRDGKPVGKSPELNVRVLKIADGDPRLPVPIIEPADSFNVIDLNEFTTTPSVIFNDWPFSGGGYTVDVNVVGIDQHGDRYTLPVATRISLSQEEERSGFSRPVSRQQLNLLQDGSNLHVETTVYFNAEALKFANSKPYVIKINSPPILSENFDSYPTKVLSLGGKITLPSMTISFQEGTGYMGITALSSMNEISGGPFESIANQSSGQILEMHISGSGETQIMHIQFNWGYSRVRCYCRFAQLKKIFVAFFDKNNKQIEQKELADTAPPQLVEGNSSENNIWSMTVTTPKMDLIAFDYFSMERK